MSLHHNEDFSSRYECQSSSSSRKTATTAKRFPLEKLLSYRTNAFIKRFSFFFWADKRETPCRKQAANCNVWARANRLFQNFAIKKSLKLLVNIEQSREHVWEQGWRTTAEFISVQIFISQPHATHAHFEFLQRVTESAKIDSRLKCNPQNVFLNSNWILWLCFYVTFLNVSAAPRYQISFCLLPLSKREKEHKTRKC